MQNEFGQEIPDDTPIVVHVRGRRVTQFDHVRQYITQVLREQREGSVETFEEANDFDVADDLFPVSAHEYAEDTEASDREVVQAGPPRPPQDGIQQPVNGGNPGGGTGGVPPVSPSPSSRAPDSEAPPSQ